MGTMVQETGQKIYTDSSEKFHEGMKRKEIEGEKSIFFDYEKEYDRIDRDFNGILSHDEITAEITRDIEENDNALKISGGGGILFGVIGLSSYMITKKVNKLATIFAIVDGLLALGSYLKINYLEKRVAQGHN